MSETAKLELPLVQAAQAQKHVTVNEAFLRLDAAVSMTVLDWDVFLPPVSAQDGDCYIVGDGASDSWTGHDAEIAVFSNGGWIFIVPMAGWRAWNVQLQMPILFDGSHWIANAIAVSGNGAATCQRVIELDHIVVAGASSVTINVIPAFAQVIGVTARVIGAITGAGISNWSLGVPGDEGLFANGLGLSLNSYALGMSGQPQTYWSDTPLVLTPDAGTFSAGEVRLAIHVTELMPPRSI